MDVSPRSLRAVTFREKLRGYHPEDVDQFLERVAEGVSALQTKLDEALARADQAEAQSAQASSGEDAVSRTLVLAQRTADLALAEAQEEAARLVAAAQKEADRVAEAAQRQLRADIERLELARKQLHADVQAMQQYVEQERARVRGTLTDLLQKVETASRRPPAPPVGSSLDLPPAPAAPEADPPVQAAPAPKPEVAAAPVEPEAQPAPPQPRRDPQPPPVSGTPFAAARAAARPTGPPPGPRRMASRDVPDPATG
jgi:cell division initiation protein